MKSSRPSAGWTPNGKTSCPGISGSTAVLDPNSAHRLEPNGRIGKPRGQGDDPHQVGVGRRNRPEREREGQRSQMRPNVEHLQNRAELAEQYRLDADPGPQRHGYGKTQKNEYIASDDNGGKPGRNIVQERQGNEGSEHQGLVGNRVKHAPEWTIQPETL